MSGAGPTIDARLGEWIDHPSGYLALAPRNQRFERAETPGFIAYREQGKHWVISGGVHAPSEARRALLEAFLEEAAQRRRRVLAVQVRAAQAPLFGDLGFTVNRFGSSYALALEGFSLAGGKRMKLRQKVRRARKLGTRILEVGGELPRDAETFARLEAISEVWLKAKGKKELDFMIGELGGAEHTERRIFVAVHGEGADARWTGFISYVPVWGERPGVLHDLTRRLPDAPPGTMELCNAEAIARLREDGVSWLHFGFTPFALRAEEPELPAASRLAAWIIGLLWRRGRLVYPALDQVRYKLKWNPEVVESEWIAFRPLSLRAIFDLLLLTRSI